MRVSEIAKELGRTNREILDVLMKNGVLGKTHSSNVSDDESRMIRSALGGAKAAKAEAPKAEPAKTETVRPAENKAGGEAAKTEPDGAKPDAPVQPAPKKKLIAVYRPQNSETMKNARAGQGRRDGQRPQGQQTLRPQGQQPLRPQGQAGQRSQSPSGLRPQGQSGSGLRPQGQSGLRPQGQQAAKPQTAGRTPAAGAGQQAARPQAPAGQQPAKPQTSGALQAGKPQTGVPVPEKEQPAEQAVVKTPVAAEQTAVKMPAAEQTEKTAAAAEQTTAKAAVPAAEQTAAKPKEPAAERKAQESPAEPPQAAQTTDKTPAAETVKETKAAAAVQGSGQAAGTEKTGSASREGGRTQGQQGAGGRDRDRVQAQGVSGSRDRSRDGGRDGSRDGSRGQGYQGRDGGRDGSRDGSRGQGYQGRDGSRDGSRGQGYQGRDGGRDGSRDGSRSQGYQGRDGGRDGSRDGSRGQGYQGRDGSRGQGYQGRDGGRDGSRGQDYQNRDGARSQGYQGRDGGRDGSRDGSRGQGYQGRDGSRGQGYQGRDGGRDGSRDGSRGQGYQGRDGGRDGSRDGSRSQGARPGQRDAAKSFDTPLATKPQSNRAQKNAHKNDRYDSKKSMNEDGPKSKGKTLSNKHPFIMPQKPAEAKVEDSIKVITLPESLTIKELADKMKLQPSAIVKKLFMKGTIVTLNQEIDYDQAEEIAMEYDVLCEREEKVDVIGDLLHEDEEDEKDMVARPPVVCVMGHVDHGKTSLLDAIRQTNVTSHEAGGITQHIGAYVVEIRGQKITFLDTPGHEAFTAMRMRGAQSTDIAVLVVAADDGVMPQTVEAINHAKAAGVEIIVAINKIDKPSANVERVKQELTEYALVPEDWGGSTIFVPVSARTKEGIEDLLEMILLAAEVKELRANPNRNARGLVIEAELDKGKGPVATVLVQKGTLHVGDNIAVGACYGKVRAMMDDKGRRVKEATPSTPVEILGLNGVPGAGEVFVMTASEKEARSFAETFISEGKNRLIEDTKAKLSLDDLFSQIQAGNVKELPIIVKADVQGSVEAVSQSLTKLSNEEVMVKVIHGGVGAINESDVTLASASNAIIIGFNVRPDATAKSVAEQEKVDIRLYRVIYQAIEDVEAAMKGMLDPVYEEQIIGHAVVRAIFKASGVGTIAGSYVMDGKLQRGCSVRITRAGEKIFEGPLASLKRFKDDVKEVNTGYECGLSFEKFNDVQEDDMIEAYAMVEVPR